MHVVNSSSVNNFNNNLDRFWSNQEVYYNFRCDITGIGNRRLSQNSELISNCIEVCYKEVDIEASKVQSLRLQHRYDRIQLYHRHHHHHHHRHNCCFTILYFDVCQVNLINNN